MLSRWPGKLMVALIWLAIWQLAAHLIALPVLLPGPGLTLVTLWQLAGDGAFWLSLVFSLLRIMLGYLLALLVGTALGLLCAAWPLAEALLSPLRTLIRSTPVSSFIILVLLWLPIGHVPLFIAGLTVLPIVWLSVQHGIAEVDKGLMEMTRAYQFGRWKRMRHLYAPSVLPYFAAAASTGLGFAWKAGIAAEVIARPLQSIGRNLQDAKVYLQTDRLFAWTLVVILLSIALEKLLRRTVPLLRRGRKP